MTHMLHRQGTGESLAEDFTLLTIRRGAITMGASGGCKKS